MGQTLSEEAMIMKKGYQKKQLANPNSYFKNVKSDILENPCMYIT